MKTTVLKLHKVYHTTRETVQQQINKQHNNNYDDNDGIHRIYWEKYSVQNKTKSEGKTVKDIDCYVRQGSMFLTLFIVQKTPNDQFG